MIAGVPAQIKLEGSIVGLDTGKELEVMVIGHDVELPAPFVAITL